MFQEERASMVAVSGGTWSHIACEWALKNVAKILNQALGSLQAPICAGSHYLSSVTWEKNVAGLDCLNSDGFADLTVPQTVH